MKTLTEQLKIVNDMLDQEEYANAARYQRGLLLQMQLLLAECRRDLGLAVAYADDGSPHDARRCLDVAIAKFEKAGVA